MRENRQYKEIKSAESREIKTGKKNDKDTKEVANMNRIDYEAMLLELEYR